MGLIANYRGRFRVYREHVDESMLMQEVRLDDFLAERYPPAFLQQFPEQAREDREREKLEIQAAIIPGDTLWLWRHVDASHRTDGTWSEWGGLAVKRASEVIRVWLVWEDC